MTTARSSGPSVTVIGAGAVGSLFAVYLSQVGAQVSVLARGDAVLPLAARGLIARHGAAVLRARPRIVENGAQVGVQDFVVLAVKSHQVNSVASHLDALVGQHTCVVTAMNGLPWWFTGRPEPSPGGEAPRPPSHDPGKRIPARQIVGCLVYVNCSRADAGIVRRNGGERIVVGAASPDGITQARRFAALLAEAKFDVRLTGEIRVDLWDKLVGNAVLNPLTALARCTIGGIQDDPGARALAEAAMEELIRLGAALGLACTASPAERLLALNPLRSCRTSMLQDVLAGRDTEIDAMVGPLLQLGAAKGIAMPVMSTIFTLARMLQREPAGSATPPHSDDAACAEVAADDCSPFAARTFHD